MTNYVFFVNISTRTNRVLTRTECEAHTAAPRHRPTINPTKSDFIAERLHPRSGLHPQSGFHCERQRTHHRTECVAYTAAPRHALRCKCVQSAKPLTPVGISPQKPDRIFGIAIATKRALNCVLRKFIARQTESQAFAIVRALRTRREDPDALRRPTGSTAGFALRSG